MKKFFFVATLLLSSIQFYATPDSWEEILETVLIEDDIPEWEIEQMCEELEILHSTPININTRAFAVALPFRMADREYSRIHLPARSDADIGRTAISWWNRLPHP